MPRITPPRLLAPVRKYCAGSRKGIDETNKHLLQTEINP